MKTNILSKKIVATILYVAIFLPAIAQTDLDAIMMNKKQFCSGLLYSHSSWNNYWEGTLKRNNENIGTVSAKSVMYMANYGISDNLNVMIGAPYIWTKASAGTLKGLNGLQDFSLFVKWRPIRQTFGKNKLSIYVLTGLSTPLTNYVTDYLPLSIGLGSTNVTARAMIDYERARFTITGSAAYIRRSNIKIDRTSYYDTELRLTNEVQMPDAEQYQLRTGYRGKYLLAEAVLTNWTTKGGFDITRNNMPFPSNRMNATMIGAAVKYTLPVYTNLSFIGATNYTIAGRNTGQATAFNAGVFYAFYVKKEKTK